MFAKGIRLFRLAGFEVRLDPSWLVLAVLVAWSLAQGFFPRLLPGLESGDYLLLGVAGVLGLVFSIVVHEFSHALVARRFGTPMGGISLFLFGGIAEMEDEPPTPKAEFLMAVAGPLMSLGLAGLTLLVLTVITAWAWPPWLIALMFYFAYLNLALGVFNLIPAFPLDGGRMLRAALWWWRGNLEQATRLAASIGQGFGLMLLAMGFVFVFSGALVAGIWWMLIGVFLRFAANSSYKRLQVRERVHGHPVSAFMTERPLVTIRSSLEMDAFMDGVAPKYRHQLYPVVDDGDRLIGCVNVAELNGHARTTLQGRSMGEVSRPCGDWLVEARSDAGLALARMLRTGADRLVVTDGERLTGMVTLGDLLHRRARV